MASDYRCATDECTLFTPGDWDSNNPVLALSLRCCRTTAYTSSALPCFTNMLLSPRPCGSRSVVHLGVIRPELRPPLVAIPSVRDTAHRSHACSSSLSKRPLEGAASARAIPRCAPDYGRSDVTESGSPDSLHHPSCVARDGGHAHSSRW